MQYKLKKIAVVFMLIVLFVPIQAMESDVDKQAGNYKADRIVTSQGELQQLSDNELVAYLCGGLSQDKRIYINIELLIEYLKDLPLQRKADMRKQLLMYSGYYIVHYLACKYANIDHRALIDLIKYVCKINRVGEFQLDDVGLMVFGDLEKIIWLDKKLEVTQEIHYIKEDQPYSAYTVVDIMHDTMLYAYLKLLVYMPKMNLEQIACVSQLLTYKADTMHAQHAYTIESSLWNSFTIAEQHLLQQIFDVNNGTSYTQAVKNYWSQMKHNVAIWYTSVSSTDIDALVAQLSDIISTETHNNIHGEALIASVHELTGSDNFSVHEQLRHMNKIALLESFITRLQTEKYGFHILRGYLSRCPFDIFIELDDVAIVISKKKLKVTGDIRTISWDHPPRKSSLKVKIYCPETMTISGDIDEPGTIETARTVYAYVTLIQLLSQVSLEKLSLVANMINLSQQASGATALFSNSFLRKVFYTCTEEERKILKRIFYISSSFDQACYYLGQCTIS